MRENLDLWLRLNALEGLSTSKKCGLMTLFGDAAKLYEADQSTLIQAGMSVKNYEDYHSDSVKREAFRILEACEKQHIEIITLSHALYPEMLKFISDPPLILYCKGNLPKLNAIAVVGSRKASGYGIETAIKLSTELAMAGILVVSGMARGIDTAAHCGALNSGCQTVAVLGCGLDLVYPPENRGLMERIMKCGAVISEYAPGTPPATFHFPCRNRIISGMSLGTLVVEAGMKSGSLITAQCALEQGREVFAVPGDISHYNSAGTNRLIKDGAKMVLSVDDILDELHFGYAPLSRKDSYQKDSFNDARNKKVLSALKIEDLYDEELCIKTGISVTELYGLLLDLELKGLIRKSINGKYRATGISH